MFSIKNLFVFLIVIYFNYLQNSHGAIQVTSRTRTIDKGIFFANWYSFNKGYFVYVICNSNSNPITNCKVVQEKYPYRDIAHRCYVTLENNGNTGFLTVVVAALNKDKAVLMWKYKDGYSTIVTIGRIDFKTCEMIRIKIPDSELSVLLELYFITKFVPYDDDSFEIFYNDPRSPDTDALLYKMQIDENGKIKSGPTIVNVERGRYLFVSSVANGLPSRGHVYERKNATDLSESPKYHLWLVKLNGTKKLLAEYNGFPRSDVSTGNNLIGLCYKPGAQSHIVCMQYDEHGNMMFKITLTGTSYKIDLLTSYNLPNDGMIIMYGMHNKCERRKFCRNETVFKVVRIGSNGEKIGSLSAQKLVIPNGNIRASYIYKNGNKGYCATVIVRNITSDLMLNMKTRLTIVANCFTEYDFSY